MQSEMKVKIQLTATFEQDKRTGEYIAYFIEFPQALGTGSDVKEAGNNLLESFKLMVEERNHDIKEQIVDKYMGSIEFNTHNFHTA